MKIYIPDTSGALLVCPVLLGGLVQLSRAMNACFGWYERISEDMPNGSWKYLTEELFRLYNYLDLMNSKDIDKYNYYSKRKSYRSHEFA